MKNEKFLTDRDVVGECPYCHKQAYGNQCEEGCGRALEPTELINPRSKETGEAPVLKETKNWYLPLNELRRRGLFPKTTNHRHSSCLGLRP